MAIFTAEIEGLDDLVKQLGKLGDTAMPYIKKGADKAGEVVLKRTKDYVPVKTGLLKKSLMLRKMGVRFGKHYLYHSVTHKGAYHIGPLEYGHKMVLFGKRTNKMVEKRPFMRNAADDSKDEVVDIMIEAMNNAIDGNGEI